MRRGFTLTELLVVTGIIAVLCAVLLPVFFTARRKGQQTTCASNLRQLAAASLMYAQDNDGVLPHAEPSGGPDDWFTQIYPLLKKDVVFRCPVCAVPDGVNKEFVYGYAANSNINSAGIMVDSPLLREGDVRYPVTTVLFAEIHFILKTGEEVATRHTTYRPDAPKADGFGLGYTLDDGYSVAGLPGALRHNGGSNYAFVDGHVRWLRPAAFVGVPADAPTAPLADGTRPSFNL